MLNWPLLRNPLNWLIVWVVMLLGAYVFHLISEHMSQPVAA